MNYVRKCILLGSVIIMTIGLSACATQTDWYGIGKTNFAHHYYQQALPQLLWSAEMLSRKVIATELTFG